MKETEKLTESEKELLTTPLVEIRKRALVPSAMEALDKKHALNRMENARERTS